MNGKPFGILVLIPPAFLIPSLPKSTEVKTLILILKLSFVNHTRALYHVAKTQKLATSVNMRW